MEEANSRQYAMTDGNGFYSIPGLRGASNSVSASKAGYVTGTRILAISGDTQLDIRLDRIETYTLSGVVFELTEAGRAPVEGVEVYCDSCGSPVGHTFTSTDADGFYSFSWSPNGVHPLFVTKTGYAIVGPTGLDPYGRISATVSGDTRFDIQLARK
jgi:hypothetical protein